MMHAIAQTLLADILSPYKFQCEFCWINYIATSEFMFVLITLVDDTF